MLMLLGVCITSIIAIAIVGYSNGQQALNQSIFNQLTSLREAKAYQIEDYFQNVRAQVQTISQTGTIIEAMKNFQAAYQELDEQSIQLEWHEQLKKYYNEKFLPELAKNTQGNPLLYSYLPPNSAARYLQYYYIAANNYPVGEKAYFNKASDGSKYSTIHEKIHPVYRNFIEQFGYYDLLLIDAKTGNIVYSVGKETDFGTNLYTGPYATSSLGEVFQKAVKEKDPEFVAISDFEPYRASYATPAAFVASPIFDGSNLIGILAFQISTDEIDRVMTGNYNWRRDGLGRSGETYLVGSDYKMRSISRFLVEQPKEYFKAIQAEGLSEAEVGNIKRQKTSIIHQPVQTPAVEKALDNETGADLVTDYRGVETLSAYRPLEIDGLDWIINAQIDRSEAFAPIRSFQKKVLYSTAIIVLLVTMIASILSYYFVRPIKILMDGFRQVSKGKTDVKVKLKGKDEFRELAHSFNDMVDSLDQQKQVIQEKIQENEQLLLSILPEPVAQRIKKGEEKIADSFSNVTVLFADLGGFSELSETLPPNETVTLLNDLVSAFDDAAEKHGVEKIKTIGSGYMAVSGLSVPRLDHAKRIIDFAQEMLKVVRRFNQEKNTDLRIRIGVNSGSVVAGIVGRSKFIYDLWGDTVNIAHRLQGMGEWNTIQVTDTVHARIAEDEYNFQPLEGVELAGNRKTVVWSTQAH
ncbi:MAG: adenylate/guanylate cyclase domain-containing protein [Pleurocapsa sp.]